MNNSEIYQEKINLLIDKLNTALSGFNLINIKTGELETINKISNVTYTISGFDITAEINNKSYLLNKAFYKTFEPNDKYNEIINNAQEDFNEIISLSNIITEEKVAVLAAEKEKKLEAKRLAELEKTKEASINNLNSAASKARMKADYYAAQYYYVLGFIAKHVKKISAAMPDYLEDWFIGIFGDVDRRVVDSNKRSPAGWIEQWGLSLTIDLDTQDIPKFLKDYMSKSKNKSQIANTAFVFDIMSTYGFKFGKSQDFEAILKSIPETYQISFSEGYNE